MAGIKQISDGIFAAFKGLKAIAIEEGKEHD
jgi:hypothetical protein